MIYKILETKQATQQWTYEVEANNEEDAIAMVLDGDAECLDYTVETDFEENGNIEVIDFYEKTPVTQQLQ